MTILNKLRELALAATPGPWKATSNQIDIGLTQQLFYTQHNVQGPHALISYHMVKSDGKADVEYIAAANPRTILALLHCLQISIKALEDYNSDEPISQNSTYSDVALYEIKAKLAEIEG